MDDSVFRLMLFSVQKFKILENASPNERRFRRSISDEKRSSFRCRPVNIGSQVGIAVVEVLQVPLEVKQIDRFAETGEYLWTRWHFG